MPRYQRHLFICVNERPPDDPEGCCASKGSGAVRAAFKAEIKKRRLSAFVRANKAGCLSNCSNGVTVVIYPEGVWYGGVTLADVDEILERHVLRGEVVERLLVREYPSGPLKLPALDLPEAVVKIQPSGKSSD